MIIKATFHASPPAGAFQQRPPHATGTDSFPGSGGSGTNAGTKIQRVWEYKQRLLEHCALMPWKPSLVSVAGRCARLRYRCEACSSPPAGCVQPPPEPRSACRAVFCPPWIALVGGVEERAAGASAKCRLCFLSAHSVGMIDGSSGVAAWREGHLGGMG